MCVPMYGDRFQHLFCLLTQNRRGKYSEQGNLFVANDCPVLLFTAFYKQSLVNLLTVLYHSVAMIFGSIPDRRCSVWIG